MINYIFYLSLIIFNTFLLSKFNFYSKFFKIEDKPNLKRKTHKTNVKVLGGTIILLNLILYLVFYLIFDDDQLLKIFNGKKDLWIFLFASISFYILGIFDDKNDLPALNKLIFTILIISVSLFLNRNLVTQINFSFLENNIDLGQFSFFFTLFAYVIFINAFNMLDGINLQIGLYSSFILLVMLSYGLETKFVFSILIGILVYLKFNYQNKIFLGDNGCLLLSFLFSFFFIELFNNNKILYSDSILLILIIPGLEVIRLSFERIISNKSILNGDRRHIHHIVFLKKNKNIGFSIIQLLLISPFLTSIFFADKLLVIILTIIIYFIIIFYFRKND